MALLVISLSMLLTPLLFIALGKADLGATLPGAQCPTGRRTKSTKPAA
jgi:hypothetical protein